MKTRFDMYGKGLFVMITETANYQIYDVCEMDEPNHITIIRDFYTKSAALKYAKENKLPVIYEA